MWVNPLYTGNLPMGTTLANSEDPNEMQHDAAFHQCLLGLKQPSGTEIHHT